MNPLEAFGTWFQQLPSEQQEQIALVVLFTTPDVGVAELVAPSFDCVNALRDWMSRPEILPIKRAGRALIIRASLETFFMRGKGDPQVERLETWAEEAKEEGYPQLATTFQQAIAAEPFRSRQWQRSLSEWRELCANELSDESLNAWVAGRPSA